jgi:hypothetical protein
MMMEPVDFQSNPQTMETNTYQAPNPENVNPIQQKAVIEFRGFRDALVREGVIVTTVIGQMGSPDDIFCNNWVSTHGDGTLVYYPMLAPNRQRERRPEIMKMFEGRYRVALDLSAEEKNGAFLESTGSLWMDRVHKIAYSALSPRTDERLACRWAEAMGFELVIFRTRNHVGKPVYHSDVMMFIGTGYAGVCLECIWDEDRAKVVESLSKTHEIIPITLDQLRSFCGNSLELRGLQDKKILVMSAQAENALNHDQKSAFLKYVDRIVSSDISTIETYGGGSARCMLLELH